MGFYCYAQLCDAGLCRCQGRGWSLWSLSLGQQSGSDAQGRGQAQCNSPTSGAWKSPKFSCVKFQSSLCYSEARRERQEIGMGGHDSIDTTLPVPHGN